MADHGKTFRLSKAELVALQKNARDAVLDSATERLKGYRSGDVEEHQANEDRRFVGSAEAFGALNAKRGRFDVVKGLPEPPESVEVEFTDAALAWLESERNEIRGGLEQQRGSVEICGASRNETFLLFVLDGVFADKETGR